MDATVIAALIAAAASLVSAAIAAKSAREQKERADKAEAREQVNVAQTSLLMAIADAQDVSLRALDHEHLNGEVKAAREQLAHAQAEYQTARSRIVNKWM